MDQAPLLDTPHDEAARRLAARQLDAAAAAAARVGAGEDPESLHDLRVALRRLRTILRLHRSVLGLRRRARRRLRDAIDGTGEARDAEVLLAWLEALPERERPARLRKRWTARAARTRRRVTGDVLPELLALLPTLRAQVSTWTVTRALDLPAPPVVRFRDVAAADLPDQAEALRARLGALGTRDAAAAHAARLAAKHLRYALEPLRAEVPAARDAVESLAGLQALLGELSDLGVRQAALTEGLGDLPASDPERPLLAALSTRVNARTSRVWRALGRDWGPSRAARLSGQVRAVAEALGAGGIPHEIERKYLLDAVPERAAAGPWERIDQGWLPGTNLHERVRHTRGAGGESFVRCVKLGRGVRRVEVEDETTPEIFSVLWGLTEGRRVRKERCRIRDGDRVWEIDRFLDLPLVLAEVELAREDEAVVCPEWLGPHVVRDVTDEAGYVNLNLAR